MSFWRRSARTPHCRFPVQPLPGRVEGQIDRMRADLISGSSLAKKAAQLGLASFLQVSEVQSKYHPELRLSMLEDAFEALVGAIYLDGGLAPARSFIEKIFADELSRAGETVSHLAPKNKLQEWSQQHYDGIRPEYSLLQTDGPAHNRQYTVEVRIHGQAIAQGSGSSKTRRSRSGRKGTEATARLMPSPGKTENSGQLITGVCSEAAAAYCVALSLQNAGSTTLVLCAEPQRLAPLAEEMQAQASWQTPEPIQVLHFPELPPPDIDPTS